MELLLIWYSPSADKFHYKIVHNYYSNNYKVGVINSYDHILINIYAITDKFILITDNKIFLKEFYSKKSIKDSIIDYLIDLLIGIKGKV